METTLAKILLDGKHSLVLDCGEIQTFDRPGVADLYTLLHSQPETLRGAEVADKVVGKAAAALMVIGGVHKVYAHVISESAAELLRANGIPFSFGSEVPYIMNRTATGSCPMDAACRDLPTVEAVHAKISEMLTAHKQTANS